MRTAAGEWRWTNDDQVNPQGIEPQILVEVIRTRAGWRKPWSHGLRSQEVFAKNEMS